MEYPLHLSRCLTSTASLRTWLAFSDTLMNCSACCNGEISTHSLQGTEFLLSFVCAYVRRGVWTSLWQGQIAWTRSNLAGITPVFTSTFSLQLSDPITIPPWLHNRPACICDFICSSCQYFCSQSLLLFTLLTMWRHVFIWRGV